MEPPTKRLRLANLLETEEDPLEDELLSLPSEVNARRDPNLKLERSRQQAVFKLKSAFESIFEKYGKDFEGVGDEIDLRTGKIVVNNGHIASLKGSELLEESESEEEGDNEDDVDENGRTLEDTQDGDKKSLGDEGRTLEGGTEADNRMLSGMGQHVMLPQMVGPSIGFKGHGGWPTMMGEAPPGFSNMMFPGPMGGFNGWPMDYGPPMNFPTSDPTWQAPALPPLYMYGPGAMTATPLVKKKRMSHISPRDDRGDSGDDVLLGVISEKTGKEVTETPSKQKLLSPKPPLNTRPEKKKRGSGRPPKSKVGTDTPKQDGQEDEEKETVEEASPQQEDAVMGEAENTPSKTTPVQAYVEVPVQDSEPPPAAPDTPITATKNDSPEHLGINTSAMAFRPRPSVVTDPPSASDPDIYIYVSDSKQKSARKPRNQSLRVEIIVKRTIDALSFKAITPEQNETESPDLQTVDVEQSTEATENPAPEEKAASRPARPPTPESERENEAQPKPPEQAFTRHAIDTDYDFSDEDEPLPVPKRPPQKKAGASGKKEEDLLRKTLRKPLSIVASTTETTDEPSQHVSMPDVQKLEPQGSGLEDKANCEDEPTTGGLKEASPQPVSHIITTETSIPDVMVRPPDISEVICRIGVEETPWPKGRRTRSSFRGGDPRGEIPDSDPIGGASTQQDLDDDATPPSPSLSFHGEEETMLEIPDSYIEPSSELGFPEAETRRDHTVPSPTLSSYAPDEGVLGHIYSLSLQPRDVAISEPTPTQPLEPLLQESSDVIPAPSSQSHNSGIPETISPPSPHTPHDSTNMTVESIGPPSSPLIPKPAQAAEGKPQLKLSTCLSLATPKRSLGARPPKTKPTTTPGAAKPTPTTSTKPASTTSANNSPTTIPATISRTIPPSTKPTKTPLPKPLSSPTTTTTTATTSTKRKRRAGVLSLLSDSEDDELSLLSPSIPPVTPITRSSPASHHVRLLPYGSASSLKRDTLFNLSSHKSRQQPGHSDKVRGFTVADKHGFGELGKEGGEEAKEKTKEKKKRGTPRAVKVCVSGRRHEGKRVKVDEGHGTVRRCGEGEGGCGRVFCFGCLRAARGGSGEEEGGCMI